MTQEEAFLRQARSDYSVFERLRAEDRSAVPECHVLHYYQMATEKLAKALLARSAQPVGRKHVAFTRVAAVLEGRDDVLKAIGCPEPREMGRFLARAEPMFRQVEGLSPKVAGDAAQASGLQHEQGRNVEYPWWELHPSTGQEWVAPADHTFHAFQTITVRSGDGLRMQTLVRRLLDNYERIP